MQPGETGDDGVRPERQPSPAQQRPAAIPAYEPAPPYRSYRPSPAAITALVAAGLGFFCSISSTSRTLNGAEATCSYFDFAPLAFGVVAAGASLAALVGARRPPHQPVVEIGVAALGMAVAALHVVRAFGIVGGPC